MNASTQEPPGADAGNQGTMGDGEARMEWTLIQRVLSGEQKAFELLVVKYQKRIERLVTRMVRDPDLASDITQDVFLSAYRSLRQFRGDARFYTWLHRIAVNTAYKALQAKKRDPVVFLSELLPENDAAEETFLEKRELTSQDTPEAVVASRQIAHAVEAAIGSLPQEYRQAWELREMEGLSYEEIAGLAEIPVGTVRSRIFRAREAIAAKVRPLLEQRNGKRW